MSWVWHTKKPDHSEPDWNAPLPDATSSRLEYLYAWERRCRGYAIHPYPVSIEPAFTPYDPDNSHGSPFLAHALPLTQAGSQSLCHLQLQFPTKQKVSAASAKNFLASLPGGHGPLAFEIVADSEEIGYQLTVPVADAQSILATAQMHWPQAAIEAGPDRLQGGLQTYSEDRRRVLPFDSFVVDFGLSQFAYLPLQTFDSFALDPLSGAIAGLGQLEAGELAGIQILFVPARSSWSGALGQVAAEFDTGADFDGHGRHRANESEATLAAQAKLVHPLYAVVIRVFALSRESGGSDSGEARSFALCKRIGGALGVFNAPGGHGSGNGLIALSNNDPHATHPHSPYPDDVHLQDVFERTSRRTGMLLSLPEFASLVHPPSESLQHPKLLRHDPNARSLPAELLNAEGVLLGIHRYRNREQGLVWPNPYRNRHAYILGATRMGKSTLLLNMIAQDMETGRGLCLIDPHGDLALDVLARVPEERAGDALYLDLSDRDYPLALGLLEAKDEQERRLLCSDLLSVLHRLFASSWGDRLEHILRHAILTLLSASHSSGRTYTLRDIRPLLSHKTFRERVVNELDDPDLKGFWTSEFYSYSPATFAPLYNKLGLLLSSPLVRNIIAQKQSKLSLGEVMQSKQILLVNLASSRIGSDSAHFLGALLVSKLQIAAMQSLRVSQSERTPFTLYVDEFQNFVVSSFETILSEAGKAGLSLVMANQFLEQLNGHLQTAILGNVGTLCSFRVSSDSGRLLEKEFAGRFKSHQLVSLNRGEAVARIGSASDSFFIETLPPPSQSEHSLASVIRDQSRESVCRPRAEVEAELAEESARQAQEEQAEERAEAEQKEATTERKRLETERKQEEKEAARQSEIQRKAAAKEQAKQKKEARAAPKPTIHWQSQSNIEVQKNVGVQTIEPDAEPSSDNSAIEIHDEIVPSQPGTAPEDALVSDVEAEASIPSEPECFGVPD